MKISELIKKLEELKKKHGDIEVKYHSEADPYFGDNKIEYLFYSEESFGEKENIIIH